MFNVNYYIQYQFYSKKWTKSISIRGKIKFFADSQKFQYNPQFDYFLTWKKQENQSEKYWNENNVSNTFNTENKVISINKKTKDQIDETLCWKSCDSNNHAEIRKKRNSSLPSDKLNNNNISKK